MILRNARSEDAAAVVAWFPDRASAVTWGGPDLPDPLTAAWLAREFARTDRDYLILEGEPVGPIGVMGLRWHPRAGRAHLIRVGLSPDARGLGLSRVLLKAAAQIAREQGLRRLTLNVYADNTPARRAYEAAGFFPSGFDGDVVHMLKPLGAAEPAQKR